MSHRAAFVLALLLAAPLPLLAADKSAEKKLPVVGQAAPFALTSQDGKTVRLADLRGKVVAVTFIYTHCPDICPLLTQKMVEVQEALGADFGPRIAFVSITLDPERDTPKVLKDFAKFWGTKPAGWFFLTGSPATIRTAMRHYGVYAKKQKDGSIDHTELTSLIDPEGRIRVQYIGYRFDADEFRRDLLSLVDNE
jgi:protein SCO1